MEIIMAFRLSRFLFVFILTLSVFGCASSGEKLSKTKIDDGLKLPAAFGVEGSGDLYSGKWWEVFHSTELNNLMDKMLANNFSLAKSYEGLKALQATLGITEADKLPTLNAGAGASEKYSTDTKGKRAWRENYDISLTASYEADIWGRISAGVESDKLEILSGRYDLESLYMTLTAELADRFFLYKSLATVLKIQKEQLDLRQKQISALEMMYSSGVGALDSVYVKQTAIAVLMESITETQKSMSDAKLQIAKLMGEPDVAKVELTDKYDFKIPVLPSVIPSDIARQRPDIQSSYATVMKIDRDKAQAMANRYPKLSFSASAGYSGDELSSLITPENFVASLVGNLVLPLFDAGRLKLQVTKQEHLLAQQIYNHYETVLTALNEVSASLTDNVQNERALRLSIEKVHIEEKRLKIAEMKYEMGIQSYSEVIENKISLLSGWITEVKSRRLLISSRVELARAAGGTWAGDIVEDRLAEASMLKGNK